jgi:hypothetical protein
LVNFCISGQLSCLFEQFHNNYEECWDLFLSFVQDAHCAAEKAYSMSKKDEMVNKVAAAANKAANAARVAAVKAVQNTMHHNNNDQ